VPEGVRGSFREPPARDPQGREPRADHATCYGALSDGRLVVSVTCESLRERVLPLTPSMNLRYLSCTYVFRLPGPLMP